MGGVTIEGGPLFPILGIIVCILFYFIYLRKKNYSFYLNIFYFLFIMYLFFVFQKTINPIPVNKIAVQNLQHVYNPKTTGPLIGLTPFDGLKYLFVDTYDIPKWIFLRQYVLNIIMTVPFGILLPLLIPKINFKKTVLYTFLFSLSIETTQLLMCLIFKANAWFFDIDDLITNTLGGVIGYLLYLIFQKILFKIIARNEIYKTKIKER